MGRGSAYRYRGNMKTGRRASATSFAPSAALARSNVMRGNLWGSIGIYAVFGVRGGDLWGTYGAPMGIYAILRGIRQHRQDCQRRARLPTSSKTANVEQDCQRRARLPTSSKTANTATSAGATDAIMPRMAADEAAMLSTAATERSPAKLSKICRRCLRVGCPYRRAACQIGRRRGASFLYSNRHA
jgi:hypothetical protein